MIKYTDFSEADQLFWLLLVITEAATIIKHAKETITAKASVPIFYCTSDTETEPNQLW